MSDPLVDGLEPGGTTPNAAFAAGQDPSGSGAGDDVETAGLEREGEPDQGPEEIEPGQG